MNPYDPEMFASLAMLLPGELTRKPLCKCQRCGKQLYSDSCGNFDQTTGVWVGVCMSCLLPEERWTVLLPHMAPKVTDDEPSIALKINPK